MLDVYLSQEAGRGQGRVAAFMIAGVALILSAGLAGAQETPPNYRLKSDAPSIHLKFTGFDEKTGEYRVLLRNASSHTVTQVSAGDFLDKSVADNSYKIDPGGTLQVKAFTPDGFRIDSVLFGDGTYQGNWKSAMMMATSEMGGVLQWEQIKPRLDEIVATDDRDEYKAERIIEEIQKLPEEVEPWMMERFRKAYPTLPQNSPYVRIWLGWALRGSKISLVDKVNGHMKAFEEYPGQVEALTAWWRSIEQLYATSHSGNK